MQMRVIDVSLDIMTGADTMRRPMKIREPTLIA